MRHLSFAVVHTVIKHSLVKKIKIAMEKSGKIIIFTHLFIFMTVLFLNVF